MLTFLDLQQSSIINVSSVTPSSDAFRLLINDAVRQLMRRGDWPGSIQPMYLCLNRGCVVWPREVGQIRRLNLCNQQVHVENQWYQYLPWDGKRWDGSCGSWSGTSYGSWAGSSLTAVGQGRSPVFQDVLGDGRTIRAYPESSLDIGKTLTLFGTDNGNQPLVTKGTGAWNDGITTTLALPYSTFTVLGSQVNVRAINRIRKDVTKARVRLYAWNAATSVLEDIGIYAGSETNPSFLRQSFNAGCCSGSNGVLALVKLAYVPIVTDQDLVLIDNIDAIKLMCQAIKLREAGDNQGGDKKEQDAIRELNLSLQDQDADTVPIDFGEIPNGIGRQHCF